jgi:hypothetical protein
VRLLFSLLAAALLHLAFFAAYPDTGPAGNVYLAASLLFWAVFLFYFNTASWLIRLVSGTAARLAAAAVLLLAAFAIAATMPQRDGVSVLKKLRRGDYPDRASLRAGLARFGVDPDKGLRTGGRELKDRAEKALRGLKAGK